jgi:hypothetical protein
MAKWVESQHSIIPLLHYSVLDYDTYRPRANQIVYRKVG